MFKDLYKRFLIFLEEIKGPSKVKISVVSERRLTCFITDIPSGIESKVEITCRTITHDLSYLKPFFRSRKFNFLEYKMKISEDTNTDNSLRKKSEIPLILPDYYPQIKDCNEKTCLNTTAYLDVLSKNDT